MAWHGTHRAPRDEHAGTGLCKPASGLLNMFSTIRFAGDSLPALAESIGMTCSLHFAQHDAEMVWLLCS